MSLEPDTLKLFVRAAALGALGKAGREFGLSATATTQRIKALERELGVQLFSRTTRAVSLTADGQVFLGHAKHIIESIEDARSDLSGGNRNIKGNLRVAGSASFGRRFIAPFIAEFLTVYPDINVELELSDSIIDIVEQGVDVALRIGDLSSSTLVARKLADNPRVLVASPEYLGDAGCPRSVADLPSHNCLVLSGNRNWKLCDTANRIHDVKVSGNFSTNHGEVVTEAALAGVGIALKSVWDVRHLLANGLLLPVLEEYTIEPVWSLWAVRPPGRVVPARTRAFVDFMEMKFNAMD